ncbi:MAG: endolytic transglycosylase MltG [Armatimonadota bacterium]
MRRAFRSRPRGKRKRGLAFWLALAILLAVAGLMVWGICVPVGSREPKLITIARGESVSDVAIMLRQEKLIRSADMFALAAYATGKWRRIQAGRHELDGTMSAVELLDALCRGSRRAWRWLTIPEGYSVRQVAQKVQEAGLGRAAEFTAAAETPGSFTTSFPLPGTGLEGCLFPDTYRVDSGETEADIIAQMLRRFDQVVWRQLFREQPSYRGRSLHDIITLASLVEWEAQRDEERPVIAGVLLNRLRRGQRLECDATVQYALGEGRKSRLMNGDLRIESPYNTYLYAGLPPGPICNPGEASIKAAMDPADVPYLYYVARPDGSHLFSATFEQHQAAIARARSGRRVGSG